MPLTRLEPSGRVADQVFDAIHAAIISGDLPAGTRLRIRDLADELGTSVMPVRESLRRLEDIGLAVAEPYRGAVVKGFTATELLELYSTRRLLETEASRLGVAGLPSGHLVALEEEHVAMSEAVSRGDVQAYVNSDEAFLMLLYIPSGNKVLLEMIQTLWQRCRAYKRRGVEQALEAGRGEELLRHQASLLEAAATRDGARAARVTAESLDDAIGRIRSSLRDV